MRAVAEKIEYSPTAIYVHFADKNELFHEVCHREYSRLAEVFQSSAMPSDPIERLKQIGRTYIGFGTHYPNHYRFMFMASHPPDELTEEEREMHGDPEVDAYAFLKWAVQEAINAGCFREELRDADLVAQTLWATVHGVIALHIARQKDEWVKWRPLQERAEVMLDVTMRGLMREKASALTQGKSPLLAEDATNGALGDEEGK